MGGASPSSWGVEEVVAWLEGLELAEHSDAFVANGVDGEMLLLLPGGHAVAGRLFPAGVQLRLGGGADAAPGHQAPALA